MEIKEQPLNNQWFKEEIPWEIRNYLAMNIKIKLINSME